jgi:large subunit ribosomal protein L15
MKLDDLRPAKGARKKRKRLGCGPGSGHGGTSGRGTKGQHARDHTIRPGFEGGQMPLIRRVPKRGFKPLKRRVFQTVNLARLAGWDVAETVTAESLAARGLIRTEEKPVKILGQGDAPSGLKVKVHAVSESAKKKIEAAGGTVEILGSSRG